MGQLVPSSGGEKTELEASWRSIQSLSLSCVLYGALPHCPCLMEMGMQSPYRPSMGSMAVPYTDRMDSPHLVGVQLGLGTTQWLFPVQTSMEATYSALIVHLWRAHLVD